MHYLIAFVLGFSLTGISLYASKKLAVRLRLLDKANFRSLHEGMKPKTGGLGIVAGIVFTQVILYFVFGQLSEPKWWLVLGLMAVMGLIDDQYNLSPIIRLVVQLFVAIFLVTGFSRSLESWHTIVLVLPIVSVVWIINGTNFMDGIDGLVGSQFLLVCLFLALFGSELNFTVERVYYWILIGSCLAFLFLNWHPSKLFLGNAGSYFIGTHLALFFIIASGSAREAATLFILLVPLLTDATLTLIRRGLAGEKIWRAHNSHVYQLWVRAGHTHAQITIALCGISVFIYFPISYLTLQRSVSPVFSILFAAILGVLIWQITYLRIRHKSKIA